MILTEAWAHAQAGVGAGPLRRAGRSVPPQRRRHPLPGYAEFGAAVDLLLADGALRERLGRAGRRHVEERYAWDPVLDRYERC